MESLLSGNLLTEDDVEAVYSGLFIDAFTEFESVIERLFLGLFDGALKSRTQPAQRTFRVSPSTSSATVIFEGKGYLDWLPLEDRTIPRANRYFVLGGPFASIDSTERAQLKRAHLLRNALAHKSDAATKNFLSSINQQALLPREKTPPGYLRTFPQGQPGPTQFSIMINHLCTASQKLCS